MAEKNTPLIDLSVEVQKTRPDYIVYQPRSLDTANGDTGNEHFLVFDAPDGGLAAIWTQSTFEGKPDQHIMFSRSRDGGRTWQPPAVIAGPDPAAGKGMASWAFPLVSKSGRIYVIYSRHIGVNDIFTHTTGLMASIYSDDLGQSWSGEQIIPMPRSRWDNPDPAVPSNWIVWQKPLRLSQGKYYAGFTRWVSPAVRPPAPRQVWWAEASVVEFMRFENVDDNPQPSDLQISYFMSHEKAMQVGLVGFPDVPVVQEPSIVPLPDGRLFCVMRTTTGSPYYTVSTDEGVTWRKPEPLRQYDGGPLLPHPCSPCPIYSMDKGEYFFLYHNHDGHFAGWGPEDGTYHRRPTCLARGLFRPQARQPVWFSEPWYFMDHGGVSLLRGDLAMYASVTREEGGVVLWYPERKFFLLGKRIPRRLLAGMNVKGKGG